MAAVKLPAWPKGIAGNVWANKLADASVYAVQSNEINYDTGTDVVIFSIPDDTVILGAAIEVTTAFTLASGESAKVLIEDSASNALCIWGARELQFTGYTPKNAFRMFSKTAGAGRRNKIITTTITGGASTGVFKIWLQLSPNRGSLDQDFV